MDEKVRRRHPAQPLAIRGAPPLPRLDQHTSSTPPSQHRPPRPLLPPLLGRYPRCARARRCGERSRSSSSSTPRTSSGCTRSSTRPRTSTWRAQHRHTCGASLGLGARRPAAVSGRRPAAPSPLAAAAATVTAAIATADSDADSRTALLHAAAQPPPSSSAPGVPAQAPAPMPMPMRARTLRTQVMEFVPGGELFDFIVSNGRLSEPRARAAGHTKLPSAVAGVAPAASSGRAGWALGRCPLQGGRPCHWARSHCRGRSSQPPPKPLIPSKPFDPALPFDEAPIGWFWPLNDAP